MTSKPQILLSNEHHKKLPVTGIRFAYNQQIRNRLKEVTTAVWSASGRCWYIEQNSFKLQLFFEQFRDLAYIDYSALKNTQVEAKTQDKRIQNYTKAKLPVPKEYLDKLEQKRYSANTIKLYCHYFEEFLGYFANSNIDEIEKDQIDVYILVLIRKNKISPSQQNQRINAIKFYYEKVLGRDKEYYNIERPHSEKVPPKVLNESKVLAILRAVDNYKHKAILSTIYSAGLRRSEIINLRKEDIDYDKNIIFIRSAKGKKDRITILSDSNARFLKAYQAKYRPKYWMFESPERKRYSTSSVAKVLNVAVIKAGLEKRITPYMLRHSFATHLLEQGVDMRYIQNLLGHESTKTTEIYTHVSKSSLHKIKSPLDRIFEDKTNDNNKLRK